MKHQRSVVLIRSDFGTSLQFAYKQQNPPIGIGYLAAFLEQHGYEVYVLDLSIKHVLVSTVVEFIKKKAPIFVGISSLTAYYQDAKKLAVELKALLPEFILVLGGVHPSFLPECVMKECNADFVVIGEGEMTILEIARALENGETDFSTIKGIAYKNGEEIMFTSERELIADLDSLPMPAWNKINPNKYPKNPHGGTSKYSNVAPIISSRGCPYSCHYCASCNFWKRRIRFRSPKNVVDEIQYLHQKFGIREIHFWDDNITLKRDHIIGICKEIIKRGLNGMAFNAPNGVKVDTLDETVLRWMKAAGFYAMTFAIESASPRILREMEKKVDLVKIIQNTILAKRIGLKLDSFFLIGFPGETNSNILRTIQFANSLPLDYRNFFILKPLPGSKIFEEWLGKQNLLNYDWDSLKCYLEVGAVNFNQIPLDKMKKLHRKAQNVNYIPPKRLINFLLNFITYFHFSEMKLITERIIHIFAGYDVSVYRSP